MAHDLRTRLPFRDGEFDCVYSSHVLEHFSRDGGEAFLSECHRVVRSEGFLRVAVPDLEGIARQYLEELNAVRARVSTDESNHEWMILELYDQVVRARPGGEMASFLDRPDLPNSNFVISRLGTEARRIIERAETRRSRSELTRPARLGPRGRAKALLWRLRTRASAMLAGIPISAIAEARFRETGENHKWMYDEVGLSRLLRIAGFRQIVRREAHTSYWGDWNLNCLDTEPDGTVYKPDSLFIECRRSD